MADINPNRDLKTDAIHAEAGRTPGNPDDFHTKGTSDNPKSYESDFVFLDDMVDPTTLDIEDKLARKIDEENAILQAKRDIEASVVSDIEVEQAAETEWEDIATEDAWAMHQRSREIRGEREHPDTAFDNTLKQATGRKNPEQQYAEGYDTDKKSFHAEEIKGGRGDRKGKTPLSDRGYFKNRLRKFLSLKKKADRLPEVEERGLDLIQTDEPEVLAPSNIQSVGKVEVKSTDPTVTESEVQTYIDSQLTRDLRGLSLEDIFGTEELQQEIAMWNHPDSKKAQVESTWEQIKSNELVAQAVQDVLQIVSDAIITDMKAQGHIRPDDIVHTEAFQKEYLHDMLFINPYTNGPLFTEHSSESDVWMIVGDAINKGFSRMMMGYQVSDAMVNKTSRAIDKAMTNARYTLDGKFRDAAE